MCMGVGGWVDSSTAVVHTLRIYSFKLQIYLYCIIGNILGPQRPGSLDGMKDIQ